MKREFYFPSKDGVTKIHAIEWVPEKDVIGILQICHGMVEHIDRYHAFAEYLSQQGYYVVGNDHLGHGLSVLSQDRYGFFHKTHGNQYVIADIHQLRVQTEKKYPNLPYFMLGHSMGSFLLRQYLGMYGGGLSGAVIMGTGQKPDIILKLGKTVCRLIAGVKGWDYRSAFVNSFGAGAFEKKMGLGWISKNQENVDAYSKDPLCSFMFTVNAYYHMFSGIQKMNRQEREGKVSKNLPILFAAGEEDPVGNNGKSVKQVYEQYLARGSKDVQMILYPGDRHEILNEDDRDKVYDDIFRWLESHNDFLRAN